MHLNHILFSIYLRRGSYLEHQRRRLPGCGRLGGAANRGTVSRSGRQAFLVSTGTLFASQLIYIAFKILRATAARKGRGFRVKLQGPNKT